MKSRSVLVSGVALLFVFSVALSAADTKEEAIKKDRKKYEGTWQVISIEENGKKEDEAKAKKMIVVNEADGKWAIEVDGKVTVRGTSEIDPTAKPRTVDLTVTEGELEGRTIPGIYQFDDGDTRKVCFAIPGQKRPSEFSSPEGSGHMLFVLKRVKK